MNCSTSCSAVHTVITVHYVVQYSAVHDVVQYSAVHHVLQYSAVHDEVQYSAVHDVVHLTMITVPALQERTSGANPRGSPPTDTVQCTVYSVHFTL